MNVDVAIIGGGMVGATLACALGKTPLKVVVIDPNTADSPANKSKFDLRVSAITRGSQRIFEHLDVWQAMVAQRVSPFREMHVWEQRDAGELHFDSAELSEPYLGHIIENRVILSSLYQRLAQHSNIQLMLGQRCTSMQYEQDVWQLSLADGESLTAKLVVGADGSHSWVRQQCAITSRGWDYDQYAVVTYVKTTLSHQATAWQRFLHDGPLAFLPLTDGYSSIVWSTSPAHATQLLALSDQEFAAELAAAYEGRLGNISEMGARASFPLRFMDAEQYILPGMALIGDAAHTIHPLAGQGVNLGILDAASLFDVIQNALTAHQPIGAQKVLRRYERWRKSENMDMFVMVDQIQRLFGAQHTGLQWLRNLGMSGLDRLTPVKNLIIDHAMGGSRGDLPQLAR